jgi:pilus assembly protein CpaE
MLVDDDAARRASVREAAIAAGAEVCVECDQGRDAVAFAVEHNPALVLVAIDAGSVRAFRAIENLRRANPGRPLIAYSGSGDLALFRQAMHAGVEDFLPLPLDAGTLRSAIDTALDASASRGNAAAPHRGTIYTVFGPKGGIGKTTISSNLGVTITRLTGESVLLIDLDLFFGDVAILTHVTPEVTVAELAWEVEDLTRERLFNALVPHESGMFILPSVRRPAEWESVDPSRLQSLIQFAVLYFDHVIIDTPGTFDETVAMAIEVADKALAVTSLDLASIKDIGLVLEFMAAADFPLDDVLVVLNHAGIGDLIAGDQVGDSLRLPVFWELPFDPAISRATQTGRLVASTTPGSRAASSLTEMACRLTGIRPREEPAPERPRGLLDRILGHRRRATA